MLRTVSDLIYQAQKLSTPVFGIDIGKFSQKENDIHRLYRYVKEITPNEKLPLDHISNYNVTFELNKSCFNPTMRPFVRKYFNDLTGFDFDNSDYPELCHFVDVLWNILSYFEAMPCFQTSLLGYMSLLANGTLPYEETVFHNLYLIDFSEAPDTVEAIQHFRLDVKNSNVRLIFKDYDTSFVETFKILTNKEKVIAYLQQYHSFKQIQRINNTVSFILSNM